MKKKMIGREFLVMGMLAVPMLLPQMAGAMDKVDTQLYPYAPSLVNWEKSKAEFTPPETCAECHPQQFEEWTGSMHALAFKDPVYQGELNKAVKAVGHDIARQCEGCHSPVGVVTGQVKGPGLTGLNSIALNGVSCDICHSVKSHTGWQTPYHQPENGSFVMSPGKETADGVVLTKYGPYKPGEDCGEGFHECVEQPLHKTTELCANCHQVHHYESHTPLESTYREWKDGPYSVKNIACQDCHMVDYDTFVRSADEFKKPERGEFRHYFNGANFLLYYLLEQAAKKGGDEALAANAHNKFEMAVNRLKAAAEVEVMPIYRDNKLAELKVRVHNKRAGHNLPTSLTNTGHCGGFLIAGGKTPDLFSEREARHGPLRSGARIFQRLMRPAGGCRRGAGIPTRIHRRNGGPQRLRSMAGGCLLRTWLVAVRLRIRHEEEKASAMLGTPSEDPTERPSRLPSPEGNCEGA